MRPTRPPGQVKGCLFPYEAVFVLSGRTVRPTVNKLRSMVQRQPVSPATILEELSQAKRAAERAAGRAAPMLVLVSGGRGAGKTTWCLELYQLAHAAGCQAGGVVSPAGFHHAVKTEIHLLNLASGERRQLARLRHASSRQPALSEATANWAFDAAVLSWGNQIIQALPESDVLILDELGPLEFIAHTGLTAGLKRVDEKRDRLACVVIRPELLEDAQTRWPWGKVIWVTAPPAEGRTG